MSRIGLVILAALLVAGCKEDPKMHSHIVEIHNCTNATDSFSSGRREGICRVTLANGYRVNVQAPAAVGDVVSWRVDSKGRIYRVRRHN